MYKGKKNKTPTSVRTLMGRRLGSLLDTLDQHQALVSTIHQLLPAPLNQHLLGALIRDRKLIIHTDSPVWASRLRFQTPGLTKALRQQGLDVDSAQIRIQPTPGKRHQKATKANDISRNAAEHLREIAATLQDSALSAALEKLARHGKD